MNSKFILAYVFYVLAAIVMVIIFGLISFFAVNWYAAFNPEQEVCKSLPFVLSIYFSIPGFFMSLGSILFPIQLANFGEKF